MINPTAQSKTARIAEVMKLTACTEEVALANLIAEEWDVADAVIDIRGATAPKFETGKSYFGIFICDSDSRETLAVASRTEKSIVTTKGKRLKIHQASTDGGEFVYPHGRHSMALIIRAARVAA